MISGLPSPATLDYILAPAFSFQKRKKKNHLIDLIWESLGRELNLCQKALEKAEGRGEIEGSVKQ